MPDSENGTSSFGRETGYLGVLDNRISTVERGQKELSSDINALGGQFERSLKAAIDSFGRQMDALSAKVDERSKIPWPALGVMLSFITVIGGLVWYPVKDKQDKLEASIQRLADVSIGKSELEQRLGTAAQRRDDFQRTTDSRAERQQRQIEDVESKIVPLEWHKEKWTANDREFSGIRSDLNRSETNLQRQVDDIKRSFGDTFSLRDALLQMQKRIDTLESNNAVLKNR